MSEEGHHSIEKAAALLGIGRANVRRVAVDGRFRLDVSDLERRIVEDVAANRHPVCVVASAGTVGTGAFDPRGGDRRGEAPPAVDTRRRLVRGICCAHPFGTASIRGPCRGRLRGPRSAQVALSSRGLRCACSTATPPRPARPSRRTPSTRGSWSGSRRRRSLSGGLLPQLSRRFRALAVWMVMSHVGIDALGRAIEENIQCAAPFRRARSGQCRLRAARTRRTLGILLSAHTTRLPVGHERSTDRGDGAGAGPHQRAVAGGSAEEGPLRSVQHSCARPIRSSRGCVLNYRTTRADMEDLLEDVRAAASS